MCQFLRVVLRVLTVLMFCFFGSALASEKGQKYASQLSSDSKEPRVAQLPSGIYTVFPNIHIHPNPGMQQYEVSIATHPSNPNIVLAAWMANDTGAVERARVGWHYTSDAGDNWTGSDTLPTVNLSHAIQDPAAGIDIDGNLFVATFASRFPGSNMMVSRSTDSGLNWDSTTFALSGVFAVDKLHMTVDVNATSPYQNYLYTAYRDPSLNPNPIKFSRSTDGGQNFSTPVVISGTIVGNRLTAGVNLAVSPDSVLYATWSAYDLAGGSLLGFNTSTDGGASWGTATSIRSINYEGGSKGIVYFNYPSMAVDRSGGPRRGWIYIVYAEENPALPDIFLIRSTDNGSSWSSPVKVNQDNSDKDQFMPWISVDPSTGNLFVVYYDSRKFPANDSAEVYISVSTDGGATYGDILVSDVPFFPKGVHRPTGDSYMGSYIGVSALQGTVWPCWMDNRTGFHQAYGSKITSFCIAKPGDVNGTLPIGLPDVIHLVNYVFDKDRPATSCLGSDPGNCWTPDPLCLGEVNGTPPIGLPDVIHLVNYVFDKDRPATSCLGSSPGNCWTPEASGVCCLPVQ